MNLRISPGEPAQSRTAPPLVPYQAAGPSFIVLRLWLSSTPRHEVWAARRVVIAPDQGAIRAAPSGLWKEKRGARRPALCVRGVCNLATHLHKTGSRVTSFTDQRLKEKRRAA
jgi:hypothetical protein